MNAGRKDIFKTEITRITDLDNNQKRIIRRSSENINIYFERVLMKVKINEPE